VRVRASDMLLIKILVAMQRRLPTTDISRTFESYDKLKRWGGGAVSTEQSPGLGEEDGKGWFLLPGVLDVRAVAIIGTELPAALGQEYVRPRKHQANTLRTASRRGVVSLSASRESGQDSGESSKGHGSWVLVGIKTGLLVVLGLRWIYYSTVLYCTVLYACMHACMMQTRMLVSHVSVGCTRRFTTKLDASLAGAAARNLQPIWEVLRRR
jgi:hypothetical protein